MSVSYMMIVIIIILIIISFFFYESWVKKSKQNTLYAKAYELSRYKGKKLLIIGDPGESNTNFWFGKYSCGDICIDINGCVCDDPSTVHIIADKIENVIGSFETDSVVIFESEVLEYVDQQYIDDVITELYRISGGDIFSVHELQPDTLVTTIKQNGYKFFNNITGKESYDCKRLFRSHPPYGRYEYTEY